MGILWYCPKLQSKLQICKLQESLESDKIKDFKFYNFTEEMNKNLPTFLINIL